MKIAVIDDEIDLLNIMRFNFEDMGHEAHTFSDLSEAINALKIGGFDYLIIDYYMPQMNGDEFIETLQKQSIAVPKILIYSGNFDLDFQSDEFKHLNITEVFRKPLGLDDLFEFINSDR